MKRHEESTPVRGSGGSRSARAGGGTTDVPPSGAGTTVRTERDWGRSATGGQAGRRRPIPPKLYRISEIVEYSRVSRQTIHNYTTMGLITEARRTRGGHRLYDESVFARLDLIEELKGRNRSLRDIRTHFAEFDQSA